MNWSGAESKTLALTQRRSSKLSLAGGTEVWKYCGTYENFSITLTLNNKLFLFRLKFEYNFPIINKRIPKEPKKPQSHSFHAFKAYKMYAWLSLRFLSKMASMYIKVSGFGRLFLNQIQYSTKTFSKNINQSYSFHAFNSYNTKCMAFQNGFYKSVRLWTSIFEPCHMPTSVLETSLI